MAAHAVLLEDSSAAFGLGIHDWGGSRVGKSNQIGGDDRTGSNESAYTPQKPTATRHFLMPPKLFTWFAAPNIKIINHAQPLQETGEAD
jgi:hypothetical protein